MRVIKIKVYTIEEHPDRQKCFEWIRGNWHNLNQNGVNEIIESIQQLSKRIGGNYDYSISQTADRGEYIIFKDYDQEELDILLPDECPLTGMLWDTDLIVGLKNGNLNNVLDSLHSDTEYRYSDEGLFDMCIHKGYEFDNEGKYIR